MAAEESEPATAGSWWYSNVKNFTSDTTFHGIKFVFEDTAFILRKVLWLLVVIAAVCLFGIMLAGNINKLTVLYPVSVDMSDDYSVPLKFPAVTICNDNQYRMSTMFTMGYFDLMILMQTNSTFGKNGLFNYRPSVMCPPSSSSVYYQELIKNVSLASCRFICNNISKVAENCSALFWNRRAGQCWLTSYTGDYDAVPPDQCDNQSWPLDSLMFFRRHRQPDLDMIYCDFERDGLCPITIQTSATCTDTFQIILASSIDVTGFTDTSLGIGQGHVLYLLSQTITAATAQLPGTPTNSCAEVVTDFVNTTGRCLQLHYNFLYKGSLHVYLRNEERLFETFVGTVRSADDADDNSAWRMLFLPLPATKTLQQVIIRAIRSTADEASGTALAIDDITIRPCTDFKRDCVLSAIGAEYIGPTSHGADGDECEYWNNTVLPVYQQAFIANMYTTLHYGTTASASTSVINTNQCRNVDYNINGPWCFNKQQMRISCVVPFCYCPEKWFTCDSGQCVPPSSPCDGKQQCFDGSDESYTTCSALNLFSVTCNFTDAYMCGYWGLTGMKTLWSKSGNVSLPADWQSYVTGKVAASVASPLGDFVHSVLVSISLIDHNTNNMLAFMLRDGRILVRANLTSVTRYSYDDSTVHYTLCLLPEHSLAFVPYVNSTLSQVKYGLNSVTEIGYNCTPGNVSASLPAAASVGSVNCSFTSADLCGYWTFSDHIFYQWTLVDKASFVPNECLQQDVTWEQCGEVGISQGQCRLQGCCWLDSTNTGIFSCYRSASNNGTTQGLSSSPKVQAVHLLDDTAEFTNPRAYLVSGTQVVTAATSCITFDIFFQYGYSFSVRAPRCVSLVNDGLLLSLREGLGPAWHKIWLPLSVTGSCDVQLQFEIIYNTTYGLGWTTAVGDVSIVEGNCIDIIRQSAAKEQPDFTAGSTIRCNFSSVYQCGFSDKSQTSIKWTRKLLALTDFYFTISVYSRSTLSLELEGNTFVTTPATSLLEARYSVNNETMSLPVVVRLHKDSYTPANEPLAFSYAISEGHIHVDPWTCIENDITAYPHYDDPNSVYDIHCAITSSSITHQVSYNVTAGSSSSGSVTSNRVPFLENYPNSYYVQMTKAETFCVECSTVVMGTCLTATDDDPCPNANNAASCDALNCCYNAEVNTCMPRLLTADTYVMTVNLPAGDSLSSARLLSPNVTIDAKTGGCLSFIVYFDIFDASLTVTLTNNTASTDFSTLGILQYPFSNITFLDSESSSLLRIKLALPPGSYSVVFIAEGEGGNIHIWDVAFLTAATCSNSRFVTLPGTSSVATNRNTTAALSDPDLTRPENMTSLLDPETFIRNDVEAVEAMRLATSNDNLTDFATMLSHQKAVMFSSCKWAGNDCSPDWLTPRFTDMGMCYTFNINSSLESLVAGSQFGLRLLINIEEYEQVEDMDKFSGLKIVIFDPEAQVEIMKQISYSASPGTSTDIGVSTDLSTFLPPPHGSCSTQKLKYFPSYSHTRCQHECTTTFYANKCNCTDLYLPDNDGAIKRCSVSTYLSCIWNAPLSEDLQKCVSSCLQECRKINYEPIVSQSLLSMQSTSLVLAGQRKAVEDIYGQALELAARVNSNSPFVLDLADISEQTVNLDYTANTSMSWLRSYNQGLLKFNTNVSLDMGLLQSVLYNLSITYNNTYDDTRLHTVQWSIKTIHQLRDVIAAMSAAQNKAIFQSLFKAQWYYKSFYALLEDCLASTGTSLFFLTQYIDLATGKDLNEITTELLPMVLYQPGVSAESCEDLLVNFTIVLKNVRPVLVYMMDAIANWTSENAAVITENSRCAIENNDDQSVCDGGTQVLNLYDLLNCSACFEIMRKHGDYLFGQNFTTTISSCLTEYSNVLSRTYWSSVRVPGFETLEDSSFLYLTDALHASQKSLEELLLVCLHGEVTGRQCANDALSLLQVMSIQVSDVSTGMSNTLNTWESLVSDSQSNIINAYTEMLDNVMELSTYLYSSYKDLFTAVSNMQIWLKSTIVVQPVLRIIPGVRNPAGTPSYAMLFLQEYHKYDRATIVETVSRIARDVMSQIEESLAEIKSQCALWQISANRVTNDLQAFLDSFAVDETFVRKNFLSLNVYFERLQVHKTVQQKSYDIVQFFSDLGGLLGLLLGGSAISIFEIVDLVVYNLALQLSGRVKFRSVSVAPHSTHEDGSKAALQNGKDNNGFSAEPSHAWGDSRTMNQNETMVSVV